MLRIPFTDQYNVSNRLWIAAPGAPVFISPISAVSGRPRRFARCTSAVSGTTLHTSPENLRHVGGDLCPQLNFTGAIENFDQIVR